MRVRCWAIAAAGAAALSGCGAHRAHATALARWGPDRLRYDLTLRHGPHQLTGTERIGFRNPFTAPLDHVWIRAWDNAYGSCARPRVRVTATGLDAHRRGCTAYRIALARPVAPGGRGSVRLRVAVSVPRRFDRFGSLGRIDILGNALPVLAVSDRGAEPRLPPYSWSGESFFSLAADWRVRLALRPGDRVAATGTRAGDVLSAHAERDFTLVLGPMQERTRRAADGTLVRWFSPRGTPASEQRSGLRMTAAALAALARDLGPYGARQLDVVDTPPHIVHTGIAMEYPELILSPAFAPAVSHEVAHQWFFRLVGDDEWSSPWLDETLAEFSAERLGWRVHGPDTLSHCMRHARHFRIPAPVDSSMGTLQRLERHRTHTIRDTLYADGPCALWDLQRRAGRARVTALLRGLVRTHRDGVLTTPELRRAIAGLPGGRHTLRELGLSG